MTERTKYFVIEGLIGAGKTSCLQYLEGKVAETVVINEPEHKYALYGNHNPLLLAYDDPHSNASMTQMHIIRTACQHYARAVSEACATPGVKMVISDRSVLSPIVFIDTNHMRGVFSPFVADFLKDELRRLSAFIPSPDGVIFLDASESLCLNRIHSRARYYESKCSISYLSDLRKKHLDLFKSMDIPVYIVHLTQDDTIRSVAIRVNDILQQEMSADGVFSMVLDE